MAAIRNDSLSSQGIRSAWPCTVSELEHEGITKLKKCLLSGPLLNVALEGKIKEYFMMIISIKQLTNLLFKSQVRFYVVTLGIFECYFFLYKDNL